jgi:hypothetical protein
MKGFFRFGGAHFGAYSRRDGTRPLLCDSSRQVAPLVASPSEDTRPLSPPCSLGPPASIATASDRALTMVRQWFVRTVAFRRSKRPTARSECERM